MKSATPVRPAFLLVNTVFVLALLAIGLVAAWPIYQSLSFVIMAVASVLVAAIISGLGLLRGWTWFTIAAITLGAYLLLGVPLAVPSALSDLGSLPASWVQFVTATVFGWKQLVTVTIPVGTYQALLVPAFLLTLGSSTIALSLNWRAKRLYVLAVPVLLALPLFGLAFGSSIASDAMRMLWFSVAPREFAIGLATLVVALAFLLWRARDARRAALRAGAAAVIRQQRGSAAGTLRRGAFALIMVLVAVLLSATVLPRMDSGDRQVLRTAIVPEITLTEFTSPLSQYRGYFGADSYNEELFAVSGDPGDGTRLRLAVLGYYDGEVFRVTDPQLGNEARDTAFARIPSSLHPEGSTDDLEIEVGAYSGVWLPTAGDLASVRFSGSDASGLADGFFYNAASRAGVQLRLLGAGDAYSLEAVLTDPVALEDIEKPSDATGLVDEDLMPEKLVEWVRLQQVGSDAAALQTLIERLRARGYLSHSLLEPQGDDADWMSDLGDYSFEPSLAGHSIDRIDALFGALIDKQADTRSTDDVDLVAAIGDDEQFAVATALLAQHLGFPARVVLGFDLGGGEDAEIVSCDDGSCAGKNLIAWVEVGGDNGEWATLDVTPQHENAVSPINNNQQDPQNLTEVVPDTAREQQPPEANPSGGDQSQQDPEPEGADLTWLTNILKVVGGSLLVLLVLFAPFLTILIAKFRRRRERLGATEPEERIVGGWDEYIDAALDHGKPLPGSETRTEIARLYGTPRALVLASMADRAVFHAEPPQADASEKFWAIVEAERRSLAAGMGRWERFRAAVSLRSFTRHLKPESPRAKR
jgi:hypothetical protein